MLKGKEVGSPGRSPFSVTSLLLPRDPSLSKGQPSTSSSSLPCCSCPFQLPTLHPCWHPGRKGGKRHHRCTKRSKVPWEQPFRGGYLAMHGIGRWMSLGSCVLAEQVAMGEADGMKCSPCDKGSNVVAIHWPQNKSNGRSFSPKKCCPLRSTLRRSSNFIIADLVHYHWWGCHSLRSLG